MPSIFQVNSPFFTPAEAAVSIFRMVMAQICNGCPISVGGEPPDPVVKLGLYVNPTEIVDSTTFAELGVEEADEVELNSEAAPDYCLGHLEGVQVSPEDNLPTIIVDEHAITTTLGATWAGAAVYADFGAGNVLLGVSSFPVSPAIGSGEAGDIIKVGGNWRLCSCVPLAE